MAGICSRAAGKLLNKDKTFQGQKFDDDLGLNWVQFKWRNHDPQIGRFIEIDPLSEKYEYNSTYAFSENKVIAHVELEGLESWEATSSLWVATQQAVASNGPQIGKIIEVAAVIATVFTVLYDLAPTQAEIKTANANNAKIGGNPSGVGGNTYTMGTTSDGKSVFKPNSREGKPFTPKEKDKVIETNKAKNNGNVVCENCGTNTTKPDQSKKGVTPPTTDRQVDHVNPKSKGGSGTADNGQVLCRDCNNKKSDKVPPPSGN